jgi:hypothetical protein
VSESCKLGKQIVRILRKLTGRIKVVRLAKLIVGSLLLWSVLAANIPFSASAADQMCTLACCAGMAPHAAGSCMDGSCHAFLGPKSHKIHLQVEAFQPSEELCGLSQIELNAQLNISKSLTGLVSTERSRDSLAPEDSISRTSLTKPCKPDCGSCASGFTNTKRQRNPAALGYAVRPRPPSGYGLSRFGYSLSQDLSSLCNQGAPRGPPVPFS